MEYHTSNFRGVTSIVVLKRKFIVWFSFFTK